MAAQREFADALIFAPHFCTGNGQVFQPDEFCVKFLIFTLVSGDERPVLPLRPCSGKARWAIQEAAVS